MNRGPKSYQSGGYGYGGAVEKNIKDVFTMILIGPALVCFYGLFLLAMDNIPVVFLLSSIAGLMYHVYR